MKKKIATVLFIGIMALISMGFRSQSAGDDFSGGKKLTLIKGVVTNSDKDKDWEKVTFGLSGLDQGEYVAFVNLYDKHGDWICTIDDFNESWDRKGHHSEVSWYTVNLNEYRIRHDFFLEVHVKGENSIYTVLSKQSIGVSAMTAPIDPEETILIVKYP